jgi:hypothetical protein
MSQYGGEPLVVVFNGYVGNGLTPTIDELLHTSQILAGLSIGLERLANNNTLHWLAGNVSLKPLEKA